MTFTPGTFARTFCQLRHSHRTILAISMKSKANYISQFVPKCSTAVQDSAISELENYIVRYRKLFVLTGAGVSTESGIRDYRSEGVGLYAVSDQRPIQYSDFLKSPLRRHRYWARNFVGWPIFSAKQPNSAHISLAELEKHGYIHWLVTQNVDSLHFKAGSERVTELHGTSAKVECLQCKHEISRYKLQQDLIKINPGWHSHLESQAPDGDVMLPDEMVKSFKMLNCSKCNGILKPKIVFFGDNVPKEDKEIVNKRLTESNAMLVFGSSLQVFSSYRLILAAHEQQKPIGIVNIGPTRGDHLASFKISAIAGDILSKLSIISLQNGLEASQPVENLSQH